MPKVNELKNAKVQQPPRLRVHKDVIGAVAQDDKNMIKLTALAQRVLVVWKDTHDVEPMVAPLRNAGCWVETATVVEDAVRFAAALKPTIVLIGDTPSGLNRVELTIQIRSVLPADAPPVFIMAPSCDSVCVTSGPGSEASAGADDSMEELLGQLNSLLSGDHPQQTGSLETNSSSERVQCNGVCLDRVRHRVAVDDEEVHLTPTEFKLLWEFVVHPGFVQSREDLTRTCKGTTSRVQTRTIDAHVKAIRQKLKDRAFLIETVHGVGYRFRDTDW